jgi:hypothetical protein
MFGRGELEKSLDKTDRVDNHRPSELVWCLQSVAPGVEVVKLDQLLRYQNETTSIAQLPREESEALRWVRDVEIEQKLSVPI